MSGTGFTRRGLLGGLGLGLAAGFPGNAAAAALARKVKPKGSAGAATRELPVAEFAELRPASAPARRDRMAHLVSRITYGATPGELARARQLGIDGYLDEQLNPESIDDSETDQAVAALFPTLSMSAPQLLALDQDSGGYHIGFELKRATIYRALFSKRQLFEVMVEFWSNHFNVFHEKDYTPWLKTVDDRDVVRRNALGRFFPLLRASAQSPAMLDYLDNAENVADGPNENYARELMELHTLSVDGGYTQDDVREVARSFTGWTIDWSDLGMGQFLFDPDTHDEGPKTFLGNAIPGHALRSGVRVLRILANHPKTAHFLSFKLCRHFVSDNPPASIVDKAAATFRSTTGDIRAVLRTIFTAPEFYASAGQKLKRPFEYEISMLRALGTTVAPPAAITDESWPMDNLIWPLYALGQVPFDWSPPNGYPDVGAAWANTNGLLNRWNLAAAVSLNWFDGIAVDVNGILAASGATTPSALVDAFATYLFPAPLADATRATLLDYVANGDPVDAPLEDWDLQNRAPALLTLLLNSPSFQWR